MDVFDKYLFDEITQDYDQDDLTTEDYEELYQRFLNLQHIPEVKPYLLAMRFLGNGIKADEENVLIELKESLDDNDTAILGLYYDCILYKNRNDNDAAQKLSELVEKGYSDKYLKEYSHINYDEEDEWDYTITCGTCGCRFGITEEENKKETVVCPSCKTVIDLDDLDEDNGDEDEWEYTITCGTCGCEFEVTEEEYNENDSVICPSCKSIIDLDDLEDDDGEYDNYEDGDIDFVKMEFESNGITGIYFTSKDVDYLRAEVFFEPVEKPCHISVRSKIVDWDELVSDIIEDDVYLDEGDYSFRTTGWGNDNFDGYSAGWLKWVIEINGDDTYSCEFCICDGIIQEPKLHIDNIKLFASKTTGAREEDMDYCTTNFRGETLEHIYFMVIMENEPGFDMYVKFSIKVIFLEDDSIVFDECIMQSLNHDTYACWQSVGYPIPDFWDKGLYKYIVKLGESNEYEGTFTVY